MRDETRDELLIAVAEWILRQTKDWWCQEQRAAVDAALTLARHEQERPTDRGA